MKIFCIGNQWRGSNDGSLFRAFSRAGHLIHIVDDKFYYPADVNSFLSKAIRKIGTPFFLKDYNRDLLRAFESFNPDVVCVYKGSSLQKETLQSIQKVGTPVFCVYPDVSFFDHGGNIPKCIPLYDFIFTTKSFGLSDLKNRFNVTQAKLIQHCADPDIHRIIRGDIKAREVLRCDASFIGSYSPKKEKILANAIGPNEDIQLKVWGNSWEKTGFNNVRKSWQKQPVYGDMYAMAINASAVNIAILSESGNKSSSGDLITSRTFHIPGAGGFMLHERTNEFLELFEEGKHAACFSGPEELADKIRYYLGHASERKAIAAAGHELVMKHHTSDHRAAEILSTLVAEGILTTNGA